MDTKKIGSVIKDRRIALKLSLEKVGLALGVNKTTVMRWERGEVSTLKSSHIYLLSKVLYLPVDTLLGFDSEEPVEDSALVLKRLEVVDVINKVKDINDLEQAKKYIELFILKK